MLRRTPFHDRHVALGARMVPFAGFDMPVQYSGIVEEHQRVRQAAGLFDVSHMGEIRFRGPKALDAVQWLVSNDVSKAAIGEAQYSVVCNASGGIVDDVFVYRIAEDDLLVCVNAANRAKDFSWFQEHLRFRDGCTMVDEGDAWAQLALQGPAAAQVLQRLTPADLSGVPRRRFVVGEVAGVSGVIIARTGYTGEDGFELFIPAGEAHPLWDALLAAGRPEGVLPIGLGARDTLRLEARNCLYGHEINDETSPYQARLGWVVKLDKPGGFLGADALRVRREADEPRLAGLMVEAKRIPREGMAVLAAGEVVGHITSGTLAPSLGRGIALAYLRKPHGRPGNRLMIDVRGKEAEAVVVDGPFLSAPAA